MGWTVDTLYGYPEKKKKVRDELDDEDANTCDYTLMLCISSLYYITKKILHENKQALTHVIGNPPSLGRSLDFVQCAARFAR